MESKKQKHEEVSLLAQMYAGTADMLGLYSDIESSNVLSRKITEIICTKGLQFDTNIGLLAILEDLSAWRVGLVKTSYLKSKLEKRSVELKVGKLAEFIDPLLVAEKLYHLSKTKKYNTSSCLPISPPLTPVVPDFNSPDNKGQEVSYSPILLTANEDSEKIPCGIPPSPLSSSPLSSDDGLNSFVLEVPSNNITSSSASSFNSTESSSSELIQDQSSSPTTDRWKTDDSDRVLMSCKVPSHKLAILTSDGRKIMKDISSSTGVEMELIKSQDCKVVIVRGNRQDCKTAIEQVEKELEKPFTKEGTLYTLPSWMQGPSYAIRLQEIARNEGCGIKELTGSTQMPSVFIYSSRQWNIRRCIDRLKELEDEYNEEHGLKHRVIVKPLTTEQNKIFYDRDELLKVKETSSLQSLLIPLLNENAKDLDVLSSEV